MTEPNEQTPVQPMTEEEFTDAMLAAVDAELSGETPAPTASEVPATTQGELDLTPPAEPARRPGLGEFTPPLSVVDQAPSFAPPPGTEQAPQQDVAPQQPQDQPAQVDYYEGLEGDRLEYFRSLEAQAELARQQRDRMQRQYDAQQGQVAKMQAEWQDYQRLREKMAAAEKIAREKGPKAYPSWEKFAAGYEDPDQGKETTEVLFNAVNDVVGNEVGALKAEFDAFREASAAREQALQNSMQAQALNQGQMQLLQLHPDALQIAATPEWKEYQEYLKTISDKYEDFYGMSESGNPHHVARTIEMFKRDVLNAAQAPQQPQAQQGPSAPSAPTQPAQQTWQQQPLQTGPSAPMPTQPAPQFAAPVQQPAGQQSPGSLEELRQYQLAASQALPPSSAGTNGAMPVQYMSQDQYADYMMARADEELRGYN